MAPSRPPKPQLLTALLALCLVLTGCSSPTVEPEAPDDDGADATGGQAAEADSRPTYAPIPANARGPAIDSAKGYLVEEIEDGLYWVTDGIYQVIFLTTGQGVIVIDAPPNLAAALPAAIAETTLEPVTHVVYSHTHADHIAAAGIFSSPTVEFIAHEATAAHLATQNDPGRLVPYGTFVGGGPVPEPTITFAESYTLTVGSQTIELHDLGPAHEPGNLFIWAPAQKVLMLVDVIFPGWAPFFDLAIAEDVPAFLAAHEQVLEFEFETFVGGHMTRLGTRADVERQQEYVLDLRQNAATALQTVDLMALVAELGMENPWALFGTYLDDVAVECARLTSDAWVGRLGGVDVVAHSHCGVMVESLRVD